MIPRVQFSLPSLFCRIHRRKRGSSPRNLVGFTFRGEHLGVWARSRSLRLSDDFPVSFFCHPCLPSSETTSGARQQTETLRTKTPVFFDVGGKRDPRAWFNDRARSLDANYIFGARNTRSSHHPVTGDPWTHESFVRSKSESWNRTVEPRDFRIFCCETLVNRLHIFELREIMAKFIDTPSRNFNVTVANVSLL